MPRGGGIGIVVAALICFCIPLVFSPKGGDFSFGISVALATILVAGIGWIDDHKPLSARVRIVVQTIAALILISLPRLWPTIGFFNVTENFESILITTLVLIAVVLAIVWSINLHNFMDGIDGLLTWQAFFVFIALGLLCGRTDHQRAFSMFVLAGTTIGFLPFNFPRARIFMGDVGSGTLGLLIALACLLAIYPRGPAFFSGILACSAFVTDATCNLVSRMWRGRRWYSAHREHLYQWMVRSGMSHARVVGWYLAWNLLIVAPVLVWVNAGRGAESPLHSARIGESLADNIGISLVATVVVYAIAVVVWIFGKRWCLQKVKLRRHAAA